MGDPDLTQIMDRKKDIIISDDENISTVEVEIVIYRHPDVLEAVIAVPDEKWGEVAKAFVVAKDGTAPTAERSVQPEQHGLEVLVE